MRQYPFHVAQGVCLPQCFESDIPKTAALEQSFQISPIEQEQVMNRAETDPVSGVVRRMCPPGRSRAAAFVTTVSGSATCSMTCPEMVCQVFLDPCSPF
jgi:hypothetical protein